MEGCNCGSKESRRYDGEALANILCLILFRICASRFRINDSVSDLLIIFFYFLVLL